MARSGVGPSREKNLPKRTYGPIKGVIWGSNWDYFGKRGVIFALIFEEGNRMVLLAYFGRDRDSIEIRGMRWWRNVGMLG